MSGRGEFFFGVAIGTGIAYAVAFFIARRFMPRRWAALVAAGACVGLALAFGGDELVALSVGGCALLALLLTLRDETPRD